MSKEEIRKIIEKTAPPMTMDSVEKITDAIFSKLQESKTAKKE